MKVGVNSKIIIRYFVKDILIWFARFDKILEKVFSIELKLIFGVLHDCVSTFPDSLILGSNEVVALLFIVEKIVDHVGLLNLSVVTVCEQLDILGKGLYVGVVAAHNYTGVVVVLVHFHESLYLC